MYIMKHVYNATKNQIQIIYSAGYLAELEERAVSLTGDRKLFRVSPFFQNTSHKLIKRWHFSREGKTTQEYILKYSHRQEEQEWEKVTQMRKVNLWVDVKCNPRSALTYSEKHSLVCISIRSSSAEGFRTAP